MLSIESLSAIIGEHLLLEEDADARVAEGLAAMECGDEAPQEEVFVRWQAKYG